MRSFWHASVPNLQGLRQDIVAALALSAIAIPEQIATARIAGVPPFVGLIVFVAAGIGFFFAGSSRYLSAGADSTIAPIFASVLATLAPKGSGSYLALCAALAIGVGLLVILSAVLRLGWVARLLSIPIAAGFLVGISCHIVVNQLPALLGLDNQSTEFGNVIYAI